MPQKRPPSWVFAKGKGKGKGKGKRQAVHSGITLDIAQQLDDVDPETAENIIEQHSFLKSFKSAQKGLQDKSMMEMLSMPAGLKAVEFAMTAIVSPTWTPTAAQLNMAGAFGKLMLLLGLPVHSDVVQVVDAQELAFNADLEETAARGLNAETFPDGARLLYIVEVDNSPVFKLGTFLTDYSRNRRGVLDRYRTRPTPPTLPADVPVNWAMTALTVRKAVVCRSEDPKPDFEIHRRLRDMAKTHGLILCGQTEFHDRALLFAAEAELDAVLELTAESMEPAAVEPDPVGNLDAVEPAAVQPTASVCNPGKMKKIKKGRKGKKKEFVGSIPFDWLK